MKGDNILFEEYKAPHGVAPPFDPKTLDDHSYPLPKPAINTDSPDADCKLILNMIYARSNGTDLDANKSNVLILVEHKTKVEKVYNSIKKICAEYHNLKHVGVWMFDANPAKAENQATLDRLSEDAGIIAMQ